MTNQKSMFLNDVIFPKVSEIVASLKSSLIGGTKGFIGWLPTFKLYLQSIDQLIFYVEDLIEKGEDKKEGVLRGANLLYQNLIYPNLPLYLKPFSGTIRMVLVDIVVSGFVDFIVGKYNQTIWAGEIVPEVVVVPTVAAEDVAVRDYKATGCCELNRCDCDVLEHKCCESGDCDCK